MADNLAINRRRRMHDRVFINAFKDVPCADCGGRFPPECMDFDHRDPATKVDKVSRLMVGKSRKTMSDEIAKCDGSAPTAIESEPRSNDRTWRN